MEVRNRPYNQEKTQTAEWKTFAANLFRFFASYGLGKEGDDDDDNGDDDNGDDHELFITCTGSVNVNNIFGLAPLIRTGMDSSEHAINLDWAGVPLGSWLAVSKDPVNTDDASCDTMTPTKELVVALVALGQSEKVTICEQLALITIFGRLPISLPKDILFYFIF